LKPEEFEASLKRGEVSPLYYFYGDEPYLVERSTDRLLEKLVDPASRDFNLNIYYGNECRGDEIVDTAQTMPMFADWRVVLVKRGQGLSQAAYDLMTHYVQDPSPTTCLIIQGEKIDQRRKFFTEIKKNGALVECKRPYENQLGSFIRDEAAGYGKRVDAAAVELLVHLVGNNLQELAAQIEKVALYIGNRDAIGIDDVRAVVSDTRVDSVFELANALGNKDMQSVLRRLQTILRDGEAPLMILAVITRHFRQLWQVREMIDRRLPEQEIGKNTGISPYFLKGMIRQARNYSTREIRMNFERLYSADLAMKSGGKPQLVLGELLQTFCRERTE
jgi:DNA polymerase-3 subunit delta